MEWLFHSIDYSFLHSFSLEHSLRARHGCLPEAQSRAARRKLFLTLNFSLLDFCSSSALGTLREFVHLQRAETTGRGRLCCLWFRECGAVEIM